MARLDECWNCKKYRTLECPSQLGLNGSKCRYFAPTEDYQKAMEEGTNPDEQMTEQADADKNSSWGNHIQIVCLIVLIIIGAVRMIAHRNVSDQEIVEFSDQERTGTFTVGPTPTLSLNKVEQRNMHHSGNIAWSLPEGFAIEKVSDSATIFVMKVPQGDIRFWVIPFKAKEYSTEDFLQRMESWEERQMMARQHAPAPFGSCWFTKLDNNRCFQWKAESFNIPENKNPDDDRVMELGAVYFPKAHCGCYVYYQGFNVAEDYSYDIFHSIYVIE